LLICSCLQDKQLLAIPTVSTVISRWGFIYTAPWVWNEIPVKVRSSPSLASFKKHLETRYFTFALCHRTIFPPSDCLCPSSRVCTRYKLVLVLYCIMSYYTWQTPSCSAVDNLLCVDCSSVPCLWYSSQLQCTRSTRVVLPENVCLSQFGLRINHTSS